MTTLHIDLHLADLDAFRSGFGANGELRRGAGVVAERIAQASDDPRHLQIELHFAEPAQAEAFLDHLRGSLWKDNPALAATPQATLLEPFALVDA